jgi:hypothetical protein|tara:strand:- start:151 stop:828 length:678 start_codon:yes stop_codon:yes gene_type:complete
MKNLALVAVGEYTNDFITSIETIEKFNKVFDTVYVLTDNVEKLQNYTSNTKLTYFFTFYNKDTFNYFDKLYFSLNLVLNTQKDTVYCDIRMINSLYDYNLNNNFEGIIYPREWGSNSSNANMLRGFGCEAFEEGYWDEFIVHIEKNGIKPESVPTIFEQTLLFNYDENYDQVISYLESVEDLFVGYSNSKENKYTAVGNGEGLALAYACIKSNVEFDKFQYIKTI